MRVIFLDIDGVLNSSEFMYSETRPGYPRRRRWPEEHLDPEKIELLNQIIDKTGAVCVLSSSWRILIQPHELEEVMAAMGFRGKIIDRTGSCGGRGKEVRDWLLEHPEVERFVILDDDSQDMDPLKEHLVRTSWDGGLEGKHVEEVVRRLEES
jgi:hypothetical protein